MPLFYKENEKKLKKLHHQLSKKQKGLKNRKKALVKLALAYEKYENQKNDFLHKLSLKLVRNYDFIAAESLDMHVKHKLPCEINIKDDDVLEVLIASIKETSFVFKLKNEYYAINHNGCIRIEKKVAMDINAKGGVDDATQKLIEERTAKNEK